MRRTLVAVALASMLAVALVPAGPLPWASATETHGPGWHSWLRGNPADVQVHTRGGAMLEGGGSDRIPAWEWFLHQAGYGDIVIVCATCGNIYNQYVLNIHDVDSVQTLKLTKPEAASDPFVIQSIVGRRRDLLRRRRSIGLRAGLEGLAGRGCRQRGDRAFGSGRRDQRRPGDPGAVPVRGGEGHDPVRSGHGGLLREEDHARTRHARPPGALLRDHRHALHATRPHGPDADVHGPRHHRRVGVAREGDRRRRGRRGARDDATAWPRSSARGTCRSSRCAPATSCRAHPERRRRRGSSMST